MKKIFIAALIIGFTYSLAWAEWLVDFNDNYTNRGIDIAVEEAMKDGITPDAIVENGLALSELNPQNLVKALYCAGAKGQDVIDAASKYGISELIVTAGFKKSVEECGDKISDTQAFTPAAQRGPAFSGTPSGSGGTSYASPSAP